MGIGLAVGALVSGVGAGTTFTLAAGFSFGFSAVAAATTLVLGALQTVLTPKPKSGSFANLAGGFAARSSGITQNIKQPITSRRALTGEARIGGAVTFMETTSNDKFLHIILTLTDHEVEEIGEIWYNDISIPIDSIDGTGLVTTGVYANKTRIKKHLGTSTQIADTDLVAETSADANFRGRGVSYLYIRHEYDKNVFPSALPIITAWVKGKKIVDTRDATTRWTPNAALIVNDLLTESQDSFVPGLGIATTAIDTTELDSSANVCDEYVTTTNLDDTITSADDSTDIITLTGLNSRLQYQFGDKVNLIGGSLPGGLAVSTDYFVMPYQRKDTVRIKLASSLANALDGTAVTISSTGTGTIRKIAEPRYHAGGIIESSQEPKTNIDDLLTAMAGSVVYAGGEWKILAGVYRTPVFTFDENHLLSSLTIRTKVSRKDRFNLSKL